MKIVPTSRCKIFLSILIHFSNVVVSSYYNNTKVYGNFEEGKVGVAGLQPNTYLHDYSKLLN
jgi:hypothetical protein